ncbi:DNA (cytosine-5-)-methyltransferase [Streptobacillus moniliformis]|uniref:DNA (cytosine-5-)-methyltransferase n=1 Tax=Streptobacillus moniliformis TaxID=34105 RepID=UPI0007E4AB5D|nr:DNA (cytosine-5-)-methyltransferase [Streptobacillus moniliformis]
MSGGRRENSGRKNLPEELRKKGVTVYLNQEELLRIENLMCDGSFSNKCSFLINYALNEYENKLNSSIKFIDLFAGLGGIRIGFEQAFNTLGISTECVFSSEIKKHAILSYTKYFGDYKIHGDIKEISVDDIPDFDFLLAGFPCQPFSSAGNRLGFNDTRGTLLFEIERILKNKKPYGFLLENVEGLINHDNGKTLETILNSLNSLGYKVNYKVLDSIEFGLAQSRKRIYIVGTKDKLISLENFDKKYSSFRDIQEKNCETLNTDFTRKLLLNYNPCDLYGKSIKDKRGGSDNIHSWDIGLKGEVTDKQKELLGALLKERRKKVWAAEIGIDWMDGMPLTLKQISTFFNDKSLKEMLNDLVQKKYLVLEYPKKLVGNKREYDITKEKGYNIVTGKLSFEFSKILNPDGVAPTLVATDVEKLGVIDNKGIRKLTIREGLRLFGFPEDYSLDFLKYRESLDLLGNTVCIPVIKSIASRIASVVKEKNINKD